MKLIRLAILMLILSLYPAINNAADPSAEPTSSPAGPTDPSDPSTDPSAASSTDSAATGGPPLSVTETRNSAYDWLSASFDTITSYISTCIEVPQFSGVTQDATTVNLTDAGKWISTGLQVTEGKTLQIEWTAPGVQPRPAKYKVMYRIDPRFENPQVFILKLDYAQNKYVSDFYQFSDGLLPRYQDTPEMTFTERLTDFTNYFNYVGRTKIPIAKDDVVNIILTDSTTYFTGVADMKTDLGSLDDLAVIYTQNPIADNKILYTNADQFCADGITVSRTEYAHNCASVGLYQDAVDNWKTFEGRITNTAFDVNKANLNPCSDSADGKDNIPLCYYDKGRGMQIKIGGTIIKDINEKFMHSSFTGKDFFYYLSDINGDLDFTTSWDIAGMYNGYPQFMKDWSAETDYATFQNSLSTAKPNLTMNFLHFGRYLLDIEIGNADSTITKNDLDTIRVEYLVRQEGIPDNSAVGTVAEMQYRGNAPETGYLYVKVTKLDENLTGSIKVKFATYTGSTWFSDLVYAKLISPLRQNFNILTMQLYTKLITNIVLQNIAKTMLVLYIVFYALTFLAGATQITVLDIVIRVVKISMILILFSENSWAYFNGYLFSVFVDGVDSLMSQVSGVTSSVGNPFGFIDPIINKYTDPTTYALLFIQMLQIFSGMTYLAIMSIIAILIYFKAIVQVIVSYCIAFVGLAVMISLAPFFITFMLFEKTKSMFDNWLSLLFNYMLQPTVLLIFFLLIDQILTDQLSQTIVRACWGTLIPLSFNFDLNSISIPISISFTLPFFPGIPFYIPEITEPIDLDAIIAWRINSLMKVATSAFMLFVISKVAGGLVDFVSSVVQQLTNVIISNRQVGPNGSMNPVKDITSDMARLASPAKSLANKARGFIKEKAVDQKISNKPNNDDGREINYDKFKSGRFPRNNQNSEDTSSTFRQNTTGLKQQRAETDNNVAQYRTSNHTNDKRMNEKHITNEQRNNREINNREKVLDKKGNANADRQATTGNNDKANNWVKGEVRDNKNTERQGVTDNNDAAANRNKVDKKDNANADRQVTTDNKANNWVKGEIKDNKNVERQGVTNNNESAANRNKLDKKDNFNAEGKSAADDTSQPTKQNKVEKKGNPNTERSRVDNKYGLGNQNKTERKLSKKLKKDFSE